MFSAYKQKKEIMKRIDLGYRGQEDKYRAILRDMGTLASITVSKKERLQINKKVEAQLKKYKVEKNLEAKRSPHIL